MWVDGEERGLKEKEKVLLPSGRGDVTGRKDKNITDMI
jgi:hypothetical protein